MYDIESTNMLLPVHNNTRTTHVAATGDDNNVAGIELHELGDLVLLEIKFDGIVDFDGGTGVTNGTAVVGDNVRDALVTDGHFPDLEELVGGLFGCDAVDGESTLNIVKETEMFVRFFDGNNIHETSGISCVRPDFPIDLNQSLVDDRDDFTTGQCVFQTITKEDGEWEGFAQFVRTGRRTRGVGTAKLVEHP